MKLLSTAFTALLFTALLPMVTFAQSADEEAIKKVTRAETEAYYRRDFNAWKATWSQDPKVTRTFIAQNGYTSVTGWDKAGTALQKEFAASASPVSVQFLNNNYVIRSDGHMAWVEYDQLVQAAGDTTAHRSREYRLLIKEGNQWKLANQLTTFPDSYGNDPLAVENDLNNTGYKLLEAKKIPEAIEVFQLNVKLHPQSWNTYDSLAEAYALAGNKEGAIKHYEKSLELNPKNENGRKALEKLKD